MTDTATPVHRFAAEDGEPGFFAAALQAGRFPFTVARYRYLVWNFFRRELLSRFRGSMLGIFWVLVQPMFLFAIYYLVFGVLFGAKTGGGANADFAIYLFSGVVAWNWFQEGSTRAMTSVLENGNLVKKVAFPCELLPVPVVIVAGIVYFVSALVLLGVGWPMGWVAPDWRLALWPVVILVEGTFVLGFGLTLANLYVFSRDLSHLYGVVSMGWFFISPIFVSPYMFTDKLGETLGSILAWNPMWSIVMVNRHVFGAKGTVDSVWVDLGFASLWAVVFLMIGYGSFMGSKHKYADLV